MITLALGEIVWGIAYRWISLTNGDNGVSVDGRPAPFGLSLDSARGVLLRDLVVFLVAVASMAIFVRSPFGASLRGTRDQPRRMNALGYNVWMIRFLALPVLRASDRRRRHAVRLLQRVHRPQALALTASAEGLLMVISGGAGDAARPDRRRGLVVIVKNVVSAYIERWNFVLGAIFVAIVVFMPEGLVPGAVRLCAWALAAAAAATQAAAPAERNRP